MESKNLVVIAAAVTLSISLVLFLSTIAYGYSYGTGMMQFGTRQHQSQMMMGGMAGNGMRYGQHMQGADMMDGMMGDMMSGNGLGTQCAIWHQQASERGTVIIMGYDFVPQTLTVKKGETVTWINMDMVIHTVESGTHEKPEKTFDSGPIDHMESFSYTFSEPGTYLYHCDPHPYMQGKIVVTD